MGKAKQHKRLRKIVAAMQLPTVIVPTHEVHIKTGEELMSEDDVTMVDGKQVIPGERYVMNYPVQMAVNHNRKVKKLVSKHKNTDVALMYGKLVHKKFGN